MEYQAKELFARHGVPVTLGRVIEDPADAAAAARALGGRVVVKAQVLTGGRGKAGGVRIAAGPAEAVERAGEILGMDIKGHTVRRVLIAPAADIAAEYYLSFLVDRANRGYLCIASTEGGVEIEEVAHTTPDAIAKVRIEPAIGVDDAKAAEIVETAGLPASAVPVVRRLWDVFVAEDASLVEVNPLVLLADGSLEALDGKVTLDDNASYRHPENTSYDDETATDPLEAEAHARGLNYVKLDGSVGIIGNGAGLVMSTLDVVAHAGRTYGVKPANFLDIGGGANAEVMANGLGVILSDPQVKSVFVNVFGGITACDAVSNGIVQALDVLGDRADKPLVVRLDGNNVDEGRRILAKANHPLVTVAATMDAAAALAAQKGA